VIAAITTLLGKLEDTHFAAGPLCQYDLRHLSLGN